MKVKCPKCHKSAELSQDFAFVKCEYCDLDMNYGEYVKFMADNDSTYSDILGDYKGGTHDQNAETLDDWDSQTS